MPRRNDRLGKHFIYFSFHFFIHVFCCFLSFIDFPIYNFTSIGIGIVIVVKLNLC